MSDRLDGRQPVHVLQRLASLTSDSCRKIRREPCRLPVMSDSDDVLLARFAAASEGFARRLRAVRPGQWASPTPCSQWTVCDLVNHMARGNLNYSLLAHGGSGEEFLRLRDADALGTNPVAAFDQSTAQFLAAFGEPGALDRVADYPLGAASGRQLVSIRVTDSVVHTWDLARAVSLPEKLDPDLVDWVLANLASTYDNIAESPVGDGTTHRFFAAPRAAGPATTSPQDRLLHIMGRTEELRVNELHLPHRCSGRLGPGAG